MDVTKQQTTLVRWSKDGPRGQRATVGVDSNLVVRTNTPLNDIGGKCQNYYVVIRGRIC